MKPKSGDQVGDIPAAAAVATTGAAPPPSPRRGVAAPPAWSGRTRGGYWGNWFFVQLIRRLGVRWAYGLLIFVAAYFTFANPSGYRCSRDFLRRVLGPQPFWKWPLLVYRHFFSFGITLLDRLAVIMSRTKITCTHEGEFLFQEYLARGHSSHGTRAGRRSAGR